jgi:3-oxoacid CoA-transferase subunit A
MSIPVYITGDMHGWVRKRADRLKGMGKLALIVLGDACFDYYLDEQEEKYKAAICKTYPDITWYLVRGNHEARPEHLNNVEIFYDDMVGGNVYIVPQYPNIRYFIDGCGYYIGQYSCLVLGGAYSVDKNYRLMMGYKWFAGEQLTKEEMNKISERCDGSRYDLILAHTCPYSYRPTHLFLEGIDQAGVDNTMEIWMEELIQNLDFHTFCFGHYHGDELIKDKGLMLYEKIITIDDAYNRELGE